jgi:hypothetical protein
MNVFGLSGGNAKASPASARAKPASRSHVKQLSTTDA